jgi:hypothetical protein
MTGVIKSKTNFFIGGLMNNFSAVLLRSCFDVPALRLTRRKKSQSPTAPPTRESDLTIARKPAGGAWSDAIWYIAHNGGRRDRGSDIRLKRMAVSPTRRPGADPAVAQ